MATTSAPATPATTGDKAVAKTPAKAKSDGTKGSVKVTVFVPAGPVARNTIFKTAISAVRDQIPLVYSLDPELGDVSETKEHDGVKGRDYEVIINYTTDVEGADPVKVDDEIAKLTVPSLTDFNDATVTTNPNVGA